MKNRFEIIKKRFDPILFDNYIDYLRKIVEGLNIKYGDQRVTFSFREEKRINFIVGQRYSFSLYINHLKGNYGVIAADKLTENAELPFSNKGEAVSTYYCYYDTFSPSSQEWQSIITALKEELNRTTKSGYRRHHNQDFENYVFGKSKISPNQEPMHFPINTILYGPPGTGKTYNTILKAAQIIENRTITDYKEALEIFNNNLHDRIEFITFHQNYSYEDFIQGLRPDTENNNELTFERKDGIFKTIADKALENLKDSEKEIEEISRIAQFKSALESFKEKILEQTEDYKINDSVAITDVDIDAFRYTGENWKTTVSNRMKFKDLIEFYNQNVKSRKDVKKLTTISGLANQHATYYFLVYQQILKELPSKIAKSNKKEKQNYVLIIDEINRANISRVFGELITLIEPDKRSHGKIPLSCTLPSGESFVVPSNLYLIGTMNTADKSIALLDIALRRRFEFEAMYPKYEIKGQEIYDVEILKKINECIIDTKGHDFQIGHAYFMEENDDLVKRMNKKVIPLLLEYYMNDEKEVKRILNAAGLNIKKGSWPLTIEATND